MQTLDNVTRSDLIEKLLDMDEHQLFDLLEAKTQDSLRDEFLKETDKEDLRELLMASTNWDDDMEDLCSRHAGRWSTFLQRSDLLNKHRPAIEREWLSRHDEE